MSTVDDALASPPGDNRPLRYVEVTGDVSKVIYRASSLGSCTKAVLATGAGNWPPEPLPPDMARVFAEGHAAEPIIRGLWDEHTGVPTVDDQLEGELYLGEVDGREVVVRFHVDGLIRDAVTGEVEALREFKKIRPGGWEDFKRRGIEIIAHYPFQVAAMMHGLGVDTCEFVGGKWDGVDDDGGPIIVDLAPHYIANPPVPLKAIRDRVLSWERKIAAGMDGGDVDCDVQMFPCPFFKFHDEKVEDAPFEIVTAAAIGAARRLKKIDAEIGPLKEKLKPLDDERKSLVDVLKQAIDGAGGGDASKITAGGVELKRIKSHYPEKLRAAYDTDALSLVKPRVKKATAASDDI